MSKKLGRKGIKLRNRLIFISLFVLLIFFINYIFENRNKLLETEKYAKQTETLIKARDNIIKNSQGTTYYVSANGTSKDGTDINNPMSLKTANAKTYNGNDIVLFKAGDTFFGTIDFKVNTIEDNFFYISSYGEGEKPIISGANILINSNAWTLEDGLYKLDLSNIKNFNGIGINGWEPYNIGFFSDEIGNIYGNRKNSKKSIKDDFDFYCEDNYLYMKCYVNPSSILGNIKFAPRNDLIRISSNTILENLNIQYTGAHGIVNMDGKKVDNIYIKNCIIQNIGGAIQNFNTFTRYGNGIEFWNNATNTIVENCIFRNIYDAAYTVQGNTVTTGFENNICKNNIFIRCTYSYETFCRNDNDNTDKIYLKNQQFVNNISIEQGKNWGYNTRPFKYSAAEFVAWEIPTKNTKIQIKNNTYYNSRRILYKHMFELIAFKKCIDVDYNKMYISKDTCFINDKGNYSEMSILKEYGIEQNSEFNLLTDEQIKKISNEKILNSNDYDEIKNYYEKLEEEFKYMEIEEELLEKYKKLSETYKKQIQENIKLEQQIEKIKQEIQDLIQGNSVIDTKQTLELLRKNYEIVNILIDEKSSNYEIINEINEIGNIYSKLLKLNTTEYNYEVSTVEKQITDIQKKANENKDLQLETVDYLLEKSQKYYKTYIQDSNVEVNEKLCKTIQIEELLKISSQILDKGIEEYIKNVVVTINYSTTEITNKNVTATLETTAKIEITNNSNSKKYTFEENGSFTYEYKIKGRALKITATVNNIDKESPKILGVTDGKVYTEPVTPQITDKNLQEVKLTFNGEIIEEYESNIKLQDEGYYVITAKDKAGNETKTEFQILINQNKDYQIQGTTINNISASTNKKDFEEKLGIETQYTVTRNGKEIKENEAIATGDVLTTKSGDNYTLIVTGDVNRDGKITIHDIIKLRIHLVYENNLDKIEQLAADCNLDEKKLGISDLIRMRIIATMQIDSK